MSDYRWGTGIKSQNRNRDNRGTYAARTLVTAKGALQRFQRTASCFYCQACDKMCSVIGISNHIVEAPNSVTYDVTLACGHSRGVMQAVKRYRKQREEFEPQATAQAKMAGQTLTEESET